MNCEKLPCVWTIQSYNKFKIKIKVFSSRQLGGGVGADLSQFTAAAALGSESLFHTPFVLKYLLLDILPQIFHSQIFDPQI